MSIKENLYNRLVDLPNDVLLNIMVSALENMQSWNGQSCTEAIMTTINAETTEKGWAMQKKSELIEEWKDRYPISDY